MTLCQKTSELALLSHCKEILKGDRHECGNYRGIIQLSIAGKLYAKILVMRLQALSEKHLPKSWYGFRPSRSTTDMIFALRQIPEKCHEQNLPLSASLTSARPSTAFLETCCGEFLAGMAVLKSSSTSSSSSMKAWKPKSWLVENYLTHFLWPMVSSKAAHWPPHSLLSILLQCWRWPKRTNQLKVYGGAPDKMAILSTCAVCLPNPKWRRCVCRNCCMLMTQPSLLTPKQSSIGHSTVSLEQLQTLASLSMPQRQRWVSNLPVELNIMTQITQP